MQKAELFNKITAAITAQLEQGVRPWAQPWNTAKCGAGHMPRNVKGNFYRGANVFWLMLAQQSAGYESPVWLTFNQAAELGGNVRKGEKSQPVFFWSTRQIEDKQSGEMRRAFLYRGYNVFNVAQCEGLDIPAYEPPPEAVRVAAAESLMAATGAKIGYGGERAFYAPSLDMVQLPPREAFVSPDAFYSTVFHEIGHWTGHESRLNRQFGARFGDSAYAFEELVAELTAAFVCGALGIASVEREDHAGYLAHWLKVLRDTPDAFMTAASKAQAAADHIIKAGAQAEAEPEDIAAIAA